MLHSKNEGDRIDHDRMFKELIQTFFEEFMLLFFPSVYEEIDFAYLSFLDKELINDVNTREKRYVDLVVETKLQQEDGLIIVHIESQASYQPDFNQRMFVYFSRLFEKHRKRILPVAVFSYDEKREEPNTLNIRFPFLNVLQFQYLTIELKKQNWRDYISQDNPVAAALLSKMGYNEKEKVEVKKEFLRMLVRLELDPARTEMLTGFFETYLKLDDDEERQLQTEIQKLDHKEASVVELISSYRKKGREEGRREGRREGKLEGKKDSICTILEAKFGSSSDSVQKKIRSIDSIQLLDSVLKSVFAAETLEEAQRVVEDSIKNGTLKG